MEEAREYVEETWQTLERRLWLPEHGLYAEEADENWRVDPYRSESGNLHMTEGRKEGRNTSRLLLKPTVNHIFSELSHQSQVGKSEAFTIIAVAPYLSYFIRFGINSQLSSLTLYR